MGVILKILMISMLILTQFALADKTDHEKEVRVAQNYLRGTEANPNFTFSMYDNRIDNLSAHCQGFLESSEKILGIPKGNKSVANNSYRHSEKHGLTIVQFDGSDSRCLYGGRLSLLVVIYDGINLYTNSLLIKKLNLSLAVYGD